MYYFKYLCKKLLEKLFNMNVKCKSPKGFQQQSCVKEFHEKKIHLLSDTCVPLVYCLWHLRLLHSFGLKLTSVCENLKIFFHYFFSLQVVSAEILMASEPGCPIEMHKIPITSGDEMYDQEETGDRFMPFHRAR